MDEYEVHIAMQIRARHGYLALAEREVRVTGTLPILQEIGYGAACVNMIHAALQDVADQVEAEAVAAEQAAAPAATATAGQALVEFALVAFVGLLVCGALVLVFGWPQIAQALGWLP